MSMQLFLAIWGAALSTLLAVMRVVEFRYGQVVLLHVDTIYKRDDDVLVVEIINLGKRRIRVRSTSILFGNPDAMKEISATAHDQLLGEGDGLVTQFTRSQLVKVVNDLGLNSGRDSTLFVRIGIVGQRAILRAIALPIPDDLASSAYARFIVANMFLGLKPLSPTRVPGKILAR